MPRRKYSIHALSSFTPHHRHTPVGAVSNVTGVPLRVDPNAPAPAGQRNLRPTLGVVARAKVDDELLYGLLWEGRSYFHCLFLPTASALSMFVLDGGLLIAPLTHASPWIAAIFVVDLG